jgi:transcriptional regulator with XRE-family HTH domain
MPGEEERPTLAARLDDLFKTVRPRGVHWTNAEVAAELKQLSPELKVGAVYLSQLRTGKRTNPSHELLAALANFFGVSVAYFFDERLAESVLAELAAVEAMRQAGVRAVAMRAAGMEEENLHAITTIMDQYRKMQGLPPVSDKVRDAE